MVSIKQINFQDEHNWKTKGNNLVSTLNKNAFVEASLKTEEALSCSDEYKYHIVIVAKGSYYSYYQEQRVPVLKYMIDSLKDQNADIQFSIVLMTLSLHEVITFSDSKSLSKEELNDKILNAPNGGEGGIKDYVDAMNFAYDIFSADDDPSVHRRFLLEEIYFPDYTEYISRTEKAAEKLHSLPNMGIIVSWEGCISNYLPWDKKMIAIIVGCQSSPKCRNVIWSQAKYLNKSFPGQFHKLCGSFSYKNPKGPESVGEERGSSAKSAKSKEKGSNEKTGANTGLIVLGACGGVAALGAVPLAYYFYRRR